MERHIRPHGPRANLSYEVTGFAGCSRLSTLANLPIGNKGCWRWGGEQPCNPSKSPRAQRLPL